MTRPEVETIAPLVRRDDEPIFDEPWQAQALGLAFSLSERGVYSPAQWSRALGAAHRRLLAQGASDTPQTYYEAVVEALEELLRESGEVSENGLDERVQTWRRAYLNTPHGKPVKLKAGRTGNAQKHANH